MVTPPKGDVLYLPVNEAGRKVAEQWDPAKDQAAGEACRAYGAGGIMHWPGRLRISWENENTLKLETDTGQQTRLFNFGRPAAGHQVSRPGRGSRSPRGNCPAAAVAGAAVVLVPRAVPRGPGRLCA